MMAEFPFKVRSSLGALISEDVRWCREQFGYEGDTWDFRFEASEDHATEYYFLFRDASIAVEFKMRFG